MNSPSYRAVLLLAHRHTPLHQPRATTYPTTPPHHMAPLRSKRTHTHTPEHTQTQALSPEHTQTRALSPEHTQTQAKKREAEYKAKGRT